MFKQREDQGFCPESPSSPVCCGREALISQHPDNWRKQKAIERSGGSLARQNTGQGHNYPEVLARPQEIHLADLSQLSSSGASANLFPSQDRTLSKGRSCTVTASGTESRAWNHQDETPQQEGEMRPESGPSLMP